MKILSLKYSFGKITYIPFTIFIKLRTHEALNVFLCYFSIKCCHRHLLHNFLHIPAFFTFDSLAHFILY